MARSILDEAHIHPAIRRKIEDNHAGIVREVQAATAANDLVVVGMAQNPHVKRARKRLDAAGIPYKYLEYGSYLDGWRRRNALKMWTGWPTFPMVFVKGVLIGRADDVERLIESGELKPAQAGDRVAMNSVVLESVLTCPHCAFAARETMPTDACQYFYECRRCKALLRPKPGDCCVFCSFGSVKCPPVQEQRAGCG